MIRLSHRVLLGFFIVAVLMNADKAMGAMIVYNPQGLAETTKLLNEAKKTINELNEMKQKFDDQIDAIGKATNIILPWVNSDKLMRQLSRDSQCLKPDFEKMFPTVEFEEQNLGSVCSGKKAYRDLLSVDKKKYSTLTNSQKTRAIEAVRTRRDRVFTDEVLKGLAQGDAAIETAETANEVAAEMNASVGTDTNVNERLATLTKGTAAQLQMMAETNKLLGQLLKLHSAYYMEVGLKVITEDAEQSKDGGSAQ